MGRERAPECSCWAGRASRSECQRGGRVPWPRPNHLGLSLSQPPAPDAALTEATDELVTPLTPVDRTHEAFERAPRHLRDGDPLQAGRPRRRQRRRLRRTHCRRSVRQARRDGHHRRGGGECRGRRRWYGRGWRDECRPAAPAAYQAHPAAPSPRRPSPTSAPRSARTTSSPRTPRACPAFTRASAAAASARRPSGEFSYCLIELSKKPTNEPTNEPPTAHHLSIITGTPSTELPSALVRA